MSKADPERLASALRANLHRRKAQSRAVAQQASGAPAQVDAPEAPLPEAALPDTPSSREPAPDQQD